MKRYCEECRDFHEENDLCPRYKEQLKQHPEWFNEMMQTMVTSTIGAPTVQRYGSAIKEHLVAYSGVDNQSGQTLTRSLKSLSQQKTNANYEYQNLRQRAGFAAESMESARTNAERAINGESGRVVRYDDVGTANHPLYDLIELDANGNAVAGTGIQMKFIGGTPQDCWSKVTSTKCQKYVDSNTPIQVPSDYYDKMLGIADEQIQKLNNQYQRLLSQGDYAKANAVKSRIEHCEKTKGLLQKSRVSSQEAVYAVEHPEKYTAKEIIKNANQAGLHAAQSGALIGGGVSIIRNVIQLKNGDIKADVAVKNIVIDTAKGAVGGYVVGAGGAALKGVMQNSTSSAVRSLSETQFPSATIGLVYGITKSAVTNFIKYKTGEITKKEMAKSFGKDAVKGALVTCSMAMIAFPEGAIGVAAAMGVAMYLDATCTNLLDEVFGEGAYEQILHACGYVASTANNIVDILDAYQQQMQRISAANTTARKHISAAQKNLQCMDAADAEVVQWMEDHNYG